MQDELLQFKIHKVWTLVDLPSGKKAISTKWVYRNKKNERGIVVRNKARLVAQGYKQEEGIDYDKVFALVARVKAIRLFLAFASFMNFPVYRMDVKSAFLYGTIEDELLELDMRHALPICWIMDFTGDKLIRLYNAQQVSDEFNGRTYFLLGFTSKAERGWDLHKSMIGSLMYLTSSRPDIMFSVCACSRFQVQPKVSHLNAVKRIFRYLKGQPKLGLWYPKDSPLILEAFSDSDYAGASLDRKSTTGGCQFLGSRLISWQCKKQTVVANSTTEAEYIAASHCCGQVLWIQNQMLDYGFNFMQTKIHVDNESAICVVKNPVYHSKTKHIEIRHHFIRDSYEKRLIEMVKIHTDHNVADLLTKAFDVSRFNFLVASIGKRGRDTKIPQSGGPPIKVGDEAVHKELGDRMERAATTTSSLEAEADGGSKNYKIFSEMLDDFDRQDVMDLHRLVEERLFDSCGIHILLMDNGISIHMMIEKKYPLTQEMLSKMLSRKLEVDHENEMAFKHLRFWHVISTGGQLFEVRNGSEIFGVDEKHRTCTCRLWQLLGRPRKTQVGVEEQVVEEEVVDEQVVEEQVVDEPQNAPIINEHSSQFEVGRSSDGRSNIQKDTKGLRLKLKEVV
ncbi:putative ribonuclease H-like domain-containing protein [Tanacetum coccineum]